MHSATTKPARRASRYTPSPALAAIIDAHAAATRELDKARAAWRPFVEAQTAAETAGPTDNDLRAARSRVPLPAILRAPAAPRAPKDCVKITYHRADGTTDQLDFQTPEFDHYPLNDVVKITDYFGDNEAARAEALKAYGEWITAQSAAAKALYTPEAKAARAASDRAFRELRIANLRELLSAAETALFTYEPMSAEDRAAHAQALIGLSSGKITRTGNVTFSEALDQHDAKRLVTALWRAIAEPASAPPTAPPAPEWTAAVERVRSAYDAPEEAFDNEALIKAVDHLLTLSPPDVAGFRFLFEVITTEAQALHLRSWDAEEGAPGGLTDEVLCDSVDWPTVTPCVVLQPQKGLQAGLIHLRRELDRLCGERASPLHAIDEDVLAGAPAWAREPGAMIGADAVARAWDEARRLHA